MSSYPSLRLIVVYGKKMQDWRSTEKNVAVSGTASGSCLQVPLYSNKPLHAMHEPGYSIQDRDIGQGIQQRGIHG